MAHSPLSAGSTADRLGAPYKAFARSRLTALSREPGRSDNGPDAGPGQAAAVACCRGYWIVAISWSCFLSSSHAADGPYSSLTSPAHSNTGLDFSKRGGHPCYRPTPTFVGRSHQRFRSRNKRV